MCEIPSDGHGKVHTQQLAQGLAMITKLADTQLWQRNLASLIRSGLFTHAEIGESHGLYTVVGVYGDGTFSAPLAKYADARRATDAAFLANQLASADRLVEAN
jgi:hypothetical protein